MRKWSSRTHNRVTRRALYTLSERHSDDLMGDGGGMTANTCIQTITNVLLARAAHVNQARTPLCAFVLNEWPLPFFLQFAIGKVGEEERKKKKKKKNKRLKKDVTSFTSKNADRDLE